MRQGTIAAALAALFLIGCDAAPASPQTVGRVTLEVSGGFTGWDRIVAVEPDGSVTINTIRPASDTRTGLTLSPADLKRLHSLVADPSFARLQPSYLPATQGADEQDYVVTAVIGSSVFNTMTRDGAEIPDLLREVLDIMLPLLSQGRPIAASS